MTVVFKATSTDLPPYCEMCFSLSIELWINVERVELYCDWNWPRGDSAL